MTMKVMPSSTRAVSFTAALPYPRVVISAAHKSSGKTVTSIGLLASIAETGVKVQPFKKGPDYIDPMWLAAAANAQCHNLDYFMMGWENVEAVFKRNAAKAELSVIEGNKGLFDSIETDGSGSTANLARKLKAPVILVVDASRITRGIAPLLLGYKTFEPDTGIAGVILNKVNSARHESKLKAAIEKYSDIPLLGCIRKTADMEIMERHLGLIPVKEDARLLPVIENIRRHVSYSLDVEKVIEIARNAPKLSAYNATAKNVSGRPVNIGVMMDRAFTFYYPENLEALQNEGARIVPVNSINDSRLPDGLDALYIGGGFPETLMEELERNEAMRMDVRLAVENGMPVYAECGGLMYLGKSISWNSKTNGNTNGKTRRMAGALDFDIIVRKKPKGHGYMELENTGKSPFVKGSGKIRAHEFHYGEVVGLNHSDFAYNVLRGNGIDGKHDGIVYKNTLASFAHLHHLGCRNWAKSFVSFAREVSYPESLRTRITAFEAIK
ncbi:MAG: cobyrinate a,c-diamide synthase [Nitrospinota bacterium]